MPPLSNLLQAALIASALSLDSFAAAVAYGTKSITIPPKSIAVITLICTSVTALAYFAGSLLSAVLPPSFAAAFAFTALFLMGIIKLLDSLTKTIIKKSGISAQLNFSIFNIKLILTLYAAPESADFDRNKTLSVKESAVLAASLSLDGIAVGIGAALLSINPAALIIFALLSNAAAIPLGCFTGIKLSSSLPFNTSYLAGIILIILAVTRLF